MMMERKAVSKGGEEEEEDRKKETRRALELSPFARNARGGSGRASSTSSSREIEGQTRARDTRRKKTKERESDLRVSVCRWALTLFARGIQKALRLSDAVPCALAVPRFFAPSRVERDDNCLCVQSPRSSGAASSALARGRREEREASATGANAPPTRGLKRNLDLDLPRLRLSCLDLPRRAPDDGHLRSRRPDPSLPRLPGRGQARLCTLRLSDHRHPPWFWQCCGGLHFFDSDHFLSSGGGGGGGEGEELAALLPPVIVVSPSPVPVFFCPRSGGGRRRRGGRCLLRQRIPRRSFPSAASAASAAAVARRCPRVPRLLRRRRPREALRLVSRRAVRN